MYGSRSLVYRSIIRSWLLRHSEGAYLSIIWSWELRAFMYIYYIFFICHFGVLSTCPSCFYQPQYIVFANDWHPEPGIIWRPCLRPTNTTTPTISSGCKEDILPRVNLLVYKNIGMKIQSLGSQMTNNILKYLGMKTCHLVTRQYTQ